MSFFKVSPNGEVKARKSTKKTKKFTRADKGTVYILKMQIVDKNEPITVYKIGVTARKQRGLEARVCEISTDHYQKYRFFPQVDPRKFSTVKEYYEVEAHMHKIYKGVQYIPDIKFDGSNELFQIEDEEELMATYDRIMADPLKYVTSTTKDPVNPYGQPVAVQDSTVDDEGYSAVVIDDEPEVFE